MTWHDQLWSRVCGPAFLPPPCISLCMRGRPGGGVNVMLATQVSLPRVGSERCRISRPRFLAECCKTQLNQDSFVFLYFTLSTFSDFHWVSLSVFSCTVLFVSISQVIVCEDRLRNDLYCVEWGVKLYSNQSNQARTSSIYVWQTSPYTSIVQHNVIHHEKYHPGVHPVDRLKG